MKRSIATLALLVSGMLAASMLSVPAGAHFNPNNHGFGHLKRHFYTKAQSNARFINVGETATNADKLDGIDSAAFQSKIHWAIVSAEATILAQSGGITVQPDAVIDGHYYLHFPIVVAGKPILVTPRYKDGAGDHIGTADPCGGLASPLTINCLTGGNTTSDLFVDVSEHDGDAVDGGFYVAVFS